MNQWGRRLRLSLFGESHGAGVGVVVDGLPPGLEVDAAALQSALDARRPGRSTLVSSRDELDRVEFLSGIHRGVVTGAPVALWIANRDVDSTPYADAGRTPRPGHADWVNLEWSRGHADLRGGGHSSGRLTAPIVAAAALVAPLLAAHGIRAAAHLHQVGELRGAEHAHSVVGMAEHAAQSSVYTAHADLEASFVERIETARRDGDSVGGAVEFAAAGVPLGLGDPFFDGVESHLAHLLFAMPAVKAVEFGAGTRAAAMQGSQHNDPYTIEAGRVAVAKNDAGGVLGGRTSGAELRGCVTVKPASSIAQPQPSVDLVRMEQATLEISGRHDPCIAVRAVPVVKACVDLALADFVLLARQEGRFAGP